MTKQLYACFVNDIIRDTRQGDNMSRIEMKGLRFGKLTVIEPVGKNNYKSLMWKCICDCGNERIVDGSGLRAGRNKSCGCASPKFPINVKTHGYVGTRVYRIWCGMNSRCSESAQGKSRKLYYEKGITVCERWKEFKNFLEDMGEPDLGMSIDRIDGTKGYYKENCRWADSKTQANNTAANHILTIDGVSKTISEWSDVTGAKPNTIVCRVRRGWELKKAIQKNPITRMEEKKLSRIKNCIACGDEFIPRTGQLKLGQGKYCSHKCSFTSRKTDALGRIAC